MSDMKKAALTILILATFNYLYSNQTNKDMSKITDLTGNVYSYLTVISFSHKENHSRVNRPYYWNCKCVCGNEVLVNSNNLKGGSTKSCGCMRSKLISKATSTHGLSSSREYNIWRAMKQRCDDHGNKRYGGRGINVCKRWSDSFENFLSDMGPCPTNKHSIDRKNTDGNYTPSNCRWATTKEQCNNMSTNVIIEYNGIKYTLMELCERHKLNYNVMQRRISHNWTVEDAINTKVRFRPKRLAT